MERKKMPKLRNGSKGGFEPGLTWLRVRHSTAELPRFITPRIKIGSKLTYFGASLKLNTTFRPASTGVDHALEVACGLIQILAEGSGCRQWAVGIPDQDSLWGPCVWSFCQYLCEATGNHQCVIKTCRASPKCRIQFQASLQSKLISYQLVFIVVWTWSDRVSCLQSVFMQQSYWNYRSISCVNIRRNWNMARSPCCKLQCSA